MATERREVRIDPESPRRQVVRNLEQRFEAIERLLALAERGRRRTTHPVGWRPPQRPVSARAAPAGAYTTALPSIADDLRRSLQRRVAVMPVVERLRLAFWLGERDLDLYCAAHHVSRDAARRLFSRNRRTGRRPSRVMEQDLP